MKQYHSRALSDNKVFELTVWSRSFVLPLPNILQEIMKDNLEHKPVKATTAKIKIPFKNKKLISMAELSGSTDTNH